MYEQVEKPKENKSRAVANSVGQKKSKVKEGFGFVDNRPETATRINKPAGYSTVSGKEQTIQTFLGRSNFNIEVKQSPRDQSPTSTMQLLSAREMITGRTYRYVWGEGEKTSQLVRIGHGGYYYFENGDHVRGAANVIEETAQDDEQGGEEDHMDEVDQVNEMEQEGGDVPVRRAPQGGDEIPVSQIEQQLACWNWAIYVLNDAVTVHELNQVFSLLERQVAFDRGGSEFLPQLTEEAARQAVITDFTFLCHQRVLQGNAGLDEAQAMINEYTARVDRVLAAVAGIRDQINNEDLTRTTKSEITRTYNYHLTEVILRSVGYEVLPAGTENTWKIGMHVKQGTYGWEHWWLRSPHGDYIDHFPGQGNGIRRNRIMPFEYGEDDIIEVPVRAVRDEHRVKAQI